MDNHHSRLGIRHTTFRLRVPHKQIDPRSGSQLLPILRGWKRRGNDCLDIIRHRLRHLRRSRRRSARLPADPPDLKKTVHHWSSTRRSAESNNLHHPNVPCRRLHRGIRTTTIDSFSPPLSLPVGLRCYRYVDNCGRECEERQQVRRGSCSS